LVQLAGAGGYRHGWVEPGGGTTLRSEGVPRQVEDASGVGVGNVEGTLQRDREIPGVDQEFERQDAECKVCGQCSPAEHDIVSQSAATPPGQDRLCHLLDALVNGIAVGDRGSDARGSTEAGDGVDEMVGEGRHIPVGTGRRSVQVIVADFLDDVLHSDQ
jgi:hypothetical protein